MILADLTSYPDCVLHKLKFGACVSTLQDGKGVILARNKSDD